MPPPAAPSFTATSLSTRRSRSVSFALVAPTFWIPCTTWIPHSSCSTNVLRYLKCEIELFLTRLVFVLEGEGVRCPILLVALHRHYMYIPPQAQIMGTHDYVCAITCSTRWLSCLATLNDDIRRMLKVAKDYHTNLAAVKTSPTISRDLPAWYHSGTMWANNLPQFGREP